MKFLGNVSRLGLGLTALCIASASMAQTYGNTTPFDDFSGHAPDYVLGVQVTIPTTVTLNSFGMIYGLANDPDDSNAIFAVYDSDPGNADLPGNLVAATNPILLTSAATYDNIVFTTTPTVGPGVYWMMALYESLANPRMDTLNGDSLVAFWANPYANGMPGTASGIQTYTGQNFNYWVNTSNPVPEPASMAALGLGALALLRRRRSAK